MLMRVLVIIVMLAMCLIATKSDAAPPGPLADPSTHIAGWMVDSKTGCAVWSPVPGPNDSVTWSGACRDGVAEGPGVKQWYIGGSFGNRLEGNSIKGHFTAQSGPITIIYPNGNKYVGEYRDDKRTGQGTLTWANGDKYVGQFQDGKRTGQGTYTWANGDKYVGQFQDGKRTGQGTFTRPNGEKYVGQFQDDKLTGQGTYTFPNGERDVGQFQDGKIAGQGTATLPNGERYVGQFQDGKLNGQGTFTFANGDKYVGQFQDGKRTGQGTLTLPNGERYVGQFQDGKFNGQGTATLPNGERYVGQFQDGKLNGRGTFTFANGDKYVGQFQDDKPTGQGTYTLPNGRVKSGMWANGQFVGSPTATFTPTNEVRLIKEGGTFKVPVLINGVIPLHFTVDSGATDVTIPADVVMTLARMGTINAADFLGDQTYQMADGRTIKSKTFRIGRLQVGSRVIENVRGTIADVKGSLLLGQSFLSRFSSVKFDYSRGVLVLE